MMQEAYTALSDEELAVLAQRDSAAMDFLLNKYKNFVRIKASGFFIIGSDHDDIMQEGMIGLYKAIRDFKPDCINAFHSFAELCVTRQILTAIRSAGRHKNEPLNKSLSLNKSLYAENGGQDFIDSINNDIPSNPEVSVIAQERLGLLNWLIGDLLTPLEKKALIEYALGKSYQQIAKESGRSVKAIDNALQRARRKMAKRLEP